ncbi:MAG TPA: NAD-dependent epimerase/dehydratase family protein [Candidatus Hydrogenedentes bacterium]|nr:NAD-dependent epimerase/dehydratase family protein [Candidatus Hydrogenedentota bacterium]
MSEAILVAGGAGFVGSSIAIALRECGAARRVVAIDSLRRRGSELNLPRLRSAGVEFVHGDIRVFDDLAAVGDVDAVIECGGEASVLAGYAGSPQFVLQANLTGAMNCFEYARTRGAAVIFLSSSRVYPIAALQGLRYGETETRFSLLDEQEVPGASSRGIAESFTLDGVRSFYGATKLSAELLLQEYSAAYGIAGVINRCGLIAGPWQMGKLDQGVVALWVARHVFQRPLSYIGFEGSGKQVRDVLHIADLTRLILLQLKDLARLSGQVYNVGGGVANSASLLELTALCESACGQATQITSDPAPRPADLPLYITDAGKIFEATGWRPEHSVARTVADVHAWIVENKSALRDVF